MTVPLPPLPPVEDAAEDAYRPGGRSMVEMLADEHEQLRRLCRELTGPAGTVEHRRQVTEVLVATTTRHLSAEEQYLYPTVRSALADGEPLADREVAADNALLRTLQRLSGAGPDDPHFVEIAREVAEELERHVRAATAEIFPELRETASEEELIRLGNRVEIAEEAAPTRPHPGTPATPPWNKVVDPAVGVVDKVRDAVTRRETYVEDLTEPPKM
ncbi:hemerythrin domain-containing protein [Micromonospora sp. NPDC049559]|uniref:hemerythrin domain-containing protein n=1 Tax=Micromonospora sp. NPDC049559 TaxID=3155923 RepID=UPI003419CB56